MGPGVSGRTTTSCYMRALKFPLPLKDYSYAFTQLSNDFLRAIVSSHRGKELSASEETKR